MIVRQFIQWLRDAPAGERAEATSALARAFLHSDLSPDDRAAAEGAMLMLLDDPSPVVRRALAETLAHAQAAPVAVVQALAADQADVAAPVLEHSPLLVDADLVELVATGSPDTQALIAGRPMLPAAVSAAIAEVAAAAACLVLIENESAAIAPFSLDRIVERHGHLAAIREALLARADLPLSTRQAVIAKLSATLADFVTARAWLSEDRAQRIAREACEKATIALAAAGGRSEVRRLVHHLCASGQLTAGLVLRALLCGNRLLFEEALSELADLPLARVSVIVEDGAGSFRALYERARLPASLYPAFRAAVEALRDAGPAIGGSARLRRQVIEQVLARCEATERDDIAPLLTLLRRFATEAAREEARLYCDALAATDETALRRAA